MLACYNTLQSRDFLQSYLLFQYFFTYFPFILMIFEICNVYNTIGACVLATMHIRVWYICDILNLFQHCV